MGLKKGFLRSNSNTIETRRIITGVLLGEFSAFILYTFFISLRETFRFFGYHVFESIVYLTEDEISFYDYFYAALASVIACNLGLRFILENSKTSHGPRSKVGQKAAINNITFYTWNTLNAMFKAFVLFAIMSITMPLHYDTNFVEDFWLLFIVLPISLFLNSWPHTYRVLGRSTFRWMLICLALTTTNTLIIKQITLIDYQKVDTVLLEDDVHTNYQIEVPVTSNFEENRGNGQKYNHVYIGIDKKGNFRRVATIIKDPVSEKLIEVLPQEIPDIMAKEPRQEHLWYHDQFIVIHADQSVKMKYINAVLNEFRTDFYGKVLYATTPKNTQYPLGHPYLKNVGILENLPFNCSSIIDQVDSLKALGYTGEQVRFPSFLCYRTIHLQEYNRLKITLTPDKLYLNNQSVTQEKLTTIVSYLFRCYQQNSALLLDVHEDCSYGQYIELQDLLRNAIMKLRHEEAYKLHGTIYQDPRNLWDESRQPMNEIRHRYPFNFIHMTKEDRYLYNFKKRIE